MTSLLKKMMSDPAKQIQKSLTEEGKLEVVDTSKLNDSTIKTMKYSKSGAKFGLTNFEKQQLRSARDYIDEMLIQGKNISDLSIYDVNEFRKWRVEQRRNTVNEDISAESKEITADNTSITTDLSINAELSGFITKMIRGTNNCIKNALKENGILDVRDISLLNNFMIKTMQYTDKGAKFSISSQEKTRLRFLSQYMRLLMTKGKDISNISIYHVD